ncbi:glycoside hydrolase family 5 protein [Botryobasidium botryosum FD-172 SS1]|uniref:Glycoside hydrolase family 5 protein n=1 Tax=Botryobasidium botryosum (strain FD-172 SS1) TaxID=930990 RepID=A0A067NB59_BOTB1|nr:glycoside hydrolase family 5 protein [Botryobasidium botryosum FD-172 SS1]
MTGLESPRHPSYAPKYNAGSTQSSAHDWLSNGPLRVQGRNFVDQWGRVCLLRGVNVSGCSKTPVNHDPETFFTAHKNATFVGRPFPLEEAPEHFARLRRWGLTFIRFIVTWEALEHAGPGKYDHEYLDYLHAILSLLPRFSITAFVSIHQDVWSRFSGGSGAPAWTLERVGFKLDALEATGAAYLGGVKVPGEENERGRWPTGYQKLAASTMATVFWAGEALAPKLKIEREKKDGSGVEEVNVQVFLQDAFLDCYEVLVKKVSNLEGVLGFEIMNEPHRGYIQLPSLHEFDYNTDLHLHDAPSAIQSFALASGHPTSIPHYVRSFPFPTRVSHHVIRNEDGIVVWREDGPTKGRCLWETHGVWGWDIEKKVAVPLKESYFTRDSRTGEKIDWYKDCWYPFIKRWEERVHRSAGKDKILFVEPIPNEFCPQSWSAEHRPANMVFAPHWYDLNALFKKAHGNFTVNVQGLSRGMFVLKALYWGHRAARSNFALQLRNLVEAGYRSLGETPVIIGECGVPMDMNDGEAFRTGDFTWQEKMMDALISGLEQNLVGFTLWTYNPLNDDVNGDYWNGENFSWFSKARAAPALKSLSQAEPALDEGARLLRAVVRPYPAKVAGIPLSFQYEVNTGAFVFEYANPSTGFTKRPQSAASVASPPLDSHGHIHARETEIFFPSSLARGRRLIVQGVKSYKYDSARQTLFVLHDEMSPGVVHRIAVALDPPLDPCFRADHFTEWRFVYLAAAISILAYYLAGALLSP